MIPLLLALTAGILLGIAVRRRTRLLKFAEQATNVSIYVLLFLLGLSIGANERIIGNLDRLGAEALALSLAATGGSVVLAFFLYRINIGEK